MLWRIQRLNIVSLHKRKLSTSTEIHVEFSKRAPLKLKFGKLAKLADGSCVGSSGSTSVLTTCVGAASNGTPQGFVPLTVDYRQKAAAAGRIPTNFLRRELGPSEKEILTARVIDRSLRPLFPKGYSSEVQVVANLLAIDGSNLPDVVALNAASASLAFSNIPWNGPIGAVRVGYTPEAGFVINPTRQELINSSLNLVLTGTRFNQAVMLEAEAANFDHVLFAEAIQYGLEHCTQIAEAIHTEATKHGKTKRKIPLFNEKLEEKERIRTELEALCMQKIRGIFMDFSHDKFSRDKATKNLAHKAINEIANGAPQEPYYEVFSQICQSVIIEMGIQSKLRVDGRQLDQLRNINCEVNMHEPLHGSALFQRGQTQVMCTVALDSLDSALKTDTISALLGGVKEKNFFLHYEFPPYATNEVGRMTGSGGRRELGHGALAEKALKAILPTNWPFTIRLTSEVLESNGSSSMASVCGGSLALLDSGVPITEPAAGVAIGLLTHNNQNVDGEFQVGQYQVLTDILGMEDYFGDMDFKVAGTRSGITALQADIKIPGLPFDIIQEALQKGQKGINQILDIMEDCISEPAKGKSNWPITETMHVPITKRGKFVGPGGANLRKILTETGVQINQSPEDVSKFNIFAPNAEAMSEAKEILKKVLVEERIPDFEFGAAYQVTITEILDRGVFVQLHPEMKPIMIPNSQLDARKIADARVLGYKEGQTILVKYYGNDPASGQVRLSRKVLTIGAASAVKNLRSAKKEHVPEPASGFVDYKRKSNNVQNTPRLGSNLMESIYEKSEEEEVIEKESILPPNEQKQLRERDQQKEVTKDAIEVNEVKAEVCESFVNDQADLPESDTISELNQSREKELCDRQIILHDVPMKSSRKLEMKAVIKRLENLITITKEDISRLNRLPSGEIRLTFKDKQIVDDIIRKNYQKNVLNDGPYNFFLIDKNIKPCLTKNALHELKKAQQEVNKKNALLKEEGDHFYVLDGDPGFRNGAGVRLVKSESKERRDRQIIIYDLNLMESQKESNLESNEESNQKSNRELKAVIKKLEDLVTITEEDISDLHQMAPGTIHVTFKDKQIVDDIMMKNCQKNVLPDGTFYYTLIDKSIKACLTKKALHNVQKANQERDKKNALLKEEDDHFYVLDGDPGFRNGVSVRLVKKDSDPKIDKFLAYISQGKANGDTFCKALADRLENCNQLLSWQKSKVFRADLTDDITRAEQAAIKGLAIYLSQKYLSQALNEDLEAMCSRFAIQMNEHPFMEAMKSKLINLNQSFNDRNVFDVKKFEPSEWFNLYRELQSYPLDCIDSVSLNDWREFESLALLSFQLSDSVVNKLVTSQQTEANEILLFKTILEHPNEVIKQRLLPDFQKASNVLFFKDQLNEYDRLENERIQRLKSWSSDEDIKKEQMKIYQTLTLNKNLLKFYNHVQWHLNDQNKVKQQRKETEEKLRTQIERGLEGHKSELMNVDTKAKVLWKKLLAGETSL